MDTLIMILLVSGFLLLLAAAVRWADAQEHRLGQEDGMQVMVESQYDPERRCVHLSATSGTDTYRVTAWEIDSPEQAADKARQFAAMYERAGAEVVR